MIGNPSAPRKLRDPGIRIEQTPMTAHGAFELAFPGLVKRLDQVEVKIAALGKQERLIERASLINRGRQGPFPHPTGARPTELADQNLLLRKGVHDLPANSFDVACGITRFYGQVLPIRQDVNGGEIDDRGKLAVTKPELPDIGIGHRHRNTSLNRLNGS